MRMKIQVLGGHGGLAKGCLTTSFLIDDVLLVDAGAVAGSLSIEDQAKIEYILISHCHLDHTKDLAFISDNCFGLKDHPIVIYTHPTVKKIIKDHLLNDILWPDFTVLPTPEKPTLKICDLNEEVRTRIGDYTITGIKVNHAFDAMGFVIEKGDTTVLFTSDTGPTDRIWEIAKETKNLKAIFTEVSFPNFLSFVAEISQHHTPSSIDEEIKKMPKDIPIILTHFKPHYREEILKEIEKLNQDRLKVLGEDGEIYNF